MPGGEGRSCINSIGGGISLASKRAPLVSVLRIYLMCTGYNLPLGVREIKKNKAPKLGRHD